MAAPGKKQDFDSETGQPLGVGLMPIEPEFQYDDVTHLNNVLAELGADEEGGGFVVVNREELTQQGRREDVYIDRFPAAEFSMENLKARWGSGKYKISVYHAGGNGLATRKTITIAKDPTASLPAVITPPVATDLSPILAAIQKSNEGVVAAIMALAQSQSKPADRGEFLRELVVMRDLFAPQQVAAPAQNPLEMMKLAIEMAKEGGDSGTPGWIGKMIDRFGEPMMTLLMSQQPAQAPMARLPNPAPINASPAATVAPQTPANEEENHMNLMLKGVIKMMQNAAIQNEPAEQYADYLINLVPESEIPQVETMLKSPTWFTELQRYAPQIAHHEAWFTQLRGLVLQFIEEDRANAPDLTSQLAPTTVVSHEDATRQQSSGDGNA